jgi:osmotically-inducible protein OsmY
VIEPFARRDFGRLAMLKRLFGIVVLVAIVAAVYVWKVRPAEGPVADASAREPGDLARGLGEQARDGLGAVGQKIEDTKITASVKTALSLNRNLHPYSIGVTTGDGIVTLQGRVDGEGLRSRAEAVAAGVPDVVRVLNQIQATPGPAPVPAEQRTMGESLDEHTLQMQVKLAFSLDRELKGSDIKVDVTRREVTLSGEVLTPAQRDRALEIARETSSVASVVDRLQTRGVPAEARTATVSAGRAPAAQRALRSNSNLARFDLQVREEGGRLVLRGRVDTPAEKDLAGLIARESAGGPVDDLVDIRPGA